MTFIMVTFKGEGERKSDLSDDIMLCVHSIMSIDKVEKGREPFVPLRFEFSSSSS